MSHSILLVDDDTFFTRMMIRSLSDMDCDFTYCSDGEECLEIVESQLFEYDLVFMDVHMPNLLGSDAARTIRSLDKNAMQRVPIIALTGDPQWCDSGRSHNAGFTDYLRKPDTLEDLKDNVQLCLQKWSKKVHAGQTALT